MEYIVKSDLYEEIRIREGLVLKIKKYRYLSYSDFYSTELKGNVKKVGARLYQLKKPLTRKEWNKGEVTYPVGTYIAGKAPVERCESKDYRFEVTSAGGSIMGSKEEVIKDLNRIINQIEEIG